MIEPLPISIVIPCRNAIERLSSHLDSLKPWIGRVEQVIVVDSSEDGSFELLKKEVHHPKVEFHQVPPGLYGAWNFGVARATSEFVYFSTIGDYTDLAGIERLTATARNLSADVVISPPELIDVHGRAIADVRWPIHRFLAARAGSEPFVPSPVESFFLIASFLPETVIGSSASNLYRRTVLTETPFPTDMGRFGDAAWMVTQGLRRKIVLIAETCARFMVHDSEHSNETVGVEVDATARLLAAAEVEANRLAAETGQAFLPAWMALRIAYEKKRVTPHRLSARTRAELITEKSRIIDAKNETLRARKAALDDARQRIAFLDREIESRNAELDRQTARITALYKRVCQLEGPYKLNARLMDAIAGIVQKLRRS